MLAFEADNAVTLSLKGKTKIMCHFVAKNLKALIKQNKTKHTRARAHARLHAHTHTHTYIYKLQKRIIINNVEEESK
jgi:calcineurin-like phosphoesterase family protein